MSRFHKRSSNETYRKLTRADLAGFDAESTKLILLAMSQGCVGKVSARNHAVLINSAKNTEAVPRIMVGPNRAAKNARASFKRFMAEHSPPADKEEPVDNSPVEMSVTKALSRCGAAFANWMNQFPQGLAPSARVRVIPSQNDHDLMFELLEQN